jgi:hypothetical protein
VFLGLWLFVIIVSVFDAILALHYRESLGTSELNPVGRTLLKLNGGGVSYLLGAKLVGTIAGGTILLVLYGRNSRIAMAVASGVAALQLCLLLFLLLA